jgi:hypothetical protein
MARLSLGEKNKMAFGIKLHRVKDRDKEISRRAFMMKEILEDLDDEAFLEYGSKYGDLAKKEKLEIAEKIAKRRY